MDTRGHKWTPFGRTAAWAAIQKLDSNEHAWTCYGQFSMKGFRELRIEFG